MDIDSKPKGFASPTALPQNIEQSLQWQEANRSWWENHPMRYDWNDQVPFNEFSPEFFLEIDKRFFNDAWVYMPWKKIPFDALIDYNSLKNKDVLEIGVGNGSHAGLLSQYAQSYTGIDLTDYAVKSTSERLRLLGLPGRILRMDAEHMEFANNTFDFIWSWGVIHHSSDTQNILKEMQRVLKPGGLAITMVYHRNLWNYYLMSGFLRGILLGKYYKNKSIHMIMQNNTDGALARYYSIKEWNKIVSKFFSVKGIMICGSKSEIMPIPAGKLKSSLMKMIPNALSRFVTNRCKFGMFLISKLEKLI